MKQRLTLLNLALLAAIALTGWRLRDGWLEARAREQRFLRLNPGAAPTKPVAPLPNVQPAIAGSYLDVAVKLLFARDRNPNVIIDPVVAPPAPVMPELPRIYGLFFLGSTPTVLLAEKQGARQKAYRAGDQVGDFKLIGFSRTEIVFEWEGQAVRRKVEELEQRTIPVQTVSTGPEPAVVAMPQTPATATTVIGAERGPGAVQLGEAKACQSGDTSPAGTVEGGFRKVVTATPFGQSCRWEPVK